MMGALPSAAPDASAMIEVSGLNQFYGGSHILWDVNMTVPRGSCTVLMGRNGMGKTTLLRCLMGLVPAASGTVRCGDTDLTGQPAGGGGERRLLQQPAHRLGDGAGRGLARRQGEGGAAGRAVQQALQQFTLVHAPAV